MKLPDRIDAPDVRRWAPVGAIVAAAMLAVFVPSREHQLIDAAIGAGPAYAAADIVDTTVAPDKSRPSEAPMTLPTPTGPFPLTAHPDDLTTGQPEAAPPGGAVEDDRSASPAEASAPSVTQADLRIVKHTWAQRPMWVGTPFGDAPEGTLPVAAMVGDPHRISYLELTGTATSLRLPVYEGDDSRDHFVGTASVSACRVISHGWEPQDGQTFSSAPAHDSDECVDGAPDRDGAHWEWDLASLGSGGRRFSVALVPTADNIGSWQISFTPEVRT